LSHSGPSIRSISRQNWILYYIQLCQNTTCVSNIHNLPDLTLDMSNTVCFVYCCPTHIVLCFCFVFLRLVYPIMPISLNCPFFDCPSVLSVNVYLQNKATYKIERNLKTKHTTLVTLRKSKKKFIERRKPLN
jgi:hypothetical protein